MDEASQRLIDSMLAEEEFYFNKNPKATWTEEETELLKNAVIIHGNNMKEIAQLFQGRTVKQIHNRIRYLVNNGFMKPIPKEEKDVLTKSDDESQEVDVESSGEISPRETNVILRLEDDDQIDLVDSEELLIENPIILEPLSPDNDESDREISVTVPKVEPKLKVPTGFKIDRETIHPFEKEMNQEFFLSEVSKKYKNKTPERYMKIRNYILDLWEEQKPKYLMKSSARKGLLGNGDVYAIARVWSFLQDVGQINVECAPIRKALKLAPKETSKSSLTISHIMNFNKRNRRVRDEYGNWIDEKDAEGRVIDHDSLSLETILEEQRMEVAKRRRLLIKEFSDEFAYDPFKLIPLQGTNMQSFSITVSLESMLVMDFHSHLASTEIIGLLGGTFDPFSCHMDIKIAFPCNSTSTEVQCEMDPESEMKARTAFQQQNLLVVGWYHSHPTFDPNPSIRDIENQSSYQALFRTADGIEPFIGIIINPYQKNNHSNIEMFHLSNEWFSNMACRKPHRYVYQLETIGQLSAATNSQLQDLISIYDKHPSKMNLEEIIEGISRKESVVGMAARYIKDAAFVRNLL